MSSTSPTTSPLWQPPRLRTRGIDGEERHATWLELFYDLILVAALTQLGQSLFHHLSPNTLIRFTVLFIPIWWSWTGMVFYATRFDSNDLVQRMFYLLQIIGVGALAINVQDGLGTTSLGFAFAYAALRLLLVIQYAIVWHYNPDVRSLLVRYIGGFSVSAVLWIASMFLPIPLRFWLWGVAMLIDLGAPMSAGKIHAEIPPHVAHVSERYGLFTIIVLGESVLATVNGVSMQHQWPVFSQIEALMGLVIAFCIWWLYFDRVGTLPGSALKDQQRVTLYQVWLYSHLPLTLALTALGVAIQAVIQSPQDVPLSYFKGVLLSGSLAMTLAAIGTAQTSSCWAGSRFKPQVWLPYGISAGIMVIAGFALRGLMLPLYWAFLAAGMLTLNVGFQLFVERKLYVNSCPLSSSATSPL